MAPIRTRKLSLPVRAAHMEEERNVCKIWWGTREERHRF